MIKKILKNTPLYRTWLDWRIVQHMQGWRPDDHERMEFYRQFVGAGDLCFDIGANNGNRTKAFLKLGAKVVAVEPQSSCQTRLRRAFGKHQRFTLVPMALGESPGTATIMTGMQTEYASMSKEWIDASSNQSVWTKSEQVEVTTLDALLGKFGTPAFTKIDVEGFEIHVLKGLSRPLRTLSLEFEPHFLHRTNECLDVLTKLGQLETNYARGEVMRLASDRWMPPSELRTTLAKLNTWGDIYVRYLPA